jgi:hypothetical protein
MRSRSLAAAVILILAVLPMSGCGTTTESANRADTAGTDFRRDYR